MIHHQPPKYHGNPLTHFLNLHTSHAAAAAALALATDGIGHHHAQLPQQHLQQGQHMHQHHHQHHHHHHLSTHLQLHQQQQQQLVDDFETATNPANHTASDKILRDSSQDSRPSSGGSQVDASGSENNIDIIDDGDTDDALVVVGGGGRASVEDDYDEELPTREATGTHRDCESGDDLLTGDDEERDDDHHCNGAKLLDDSARGHDEVQRYNRTPNGGSGTPLDADGIGKSFTIAAILGLKKKKQQQQQFEQEATDSDVMNLSLNHSGIRSAFQQRTAAAIRLHLAGAERRTSDSGAECSLDGAGGGSPFGGQQSSSVAGVASSSLTALQSLHQLPVHASSGFSAAHTQFHQHHHQQHQHPHSHQSVGHFASQSALPFQQQPGTQQLHHHHHLQQQQHQQQQQQQQHQQLQQQQQNLQPGQHLSSHHLAAMGPHHPGQNHSRDKFKDLSKKSSLSTSASLKSKRVRTIFTPEQLERLEAEFERQQYMVGPERLYLAHTLQLTEAQVKVWFQNRRIKWRKHHLEITQQRLALIRQRQIANGAVPAVAHLNPPGTPLGAVAGGRLLNAPESPELTICTDSMEARSVSESDD